MGKTISHSGIIESITSDNVLVRIVQSSACSSCKIASACNSSESKEKIISVKRNGILNYAVGDEVKVMAAESIGAIAVAFAFVIPLVIMLLGVYIPLQFGASEGLAGGIAILSLVPYYILLRLCNGYFKRVITFYIA